MSFAMLSAISLICVDAAMAARPLPAALPASVAVAALAQDDQAAPADKTPDLTTPPAQDVGAAPVISAPDENVSAEEEYKGPLAFEGESDDAVVQRLAAYLEGLDTLQGDFTQIAPSGAVSTGRFYLRRPGFLRFEYDPPTPLLIVANGGMVYVQDQALDTTDSYPVGKTPLKFLLSKKLDLNDANVIAVDRGVDNVAVTLSSKKDETEGELTIIAKAPDMVLTRWIVRDLDNGVTVVSLKNVKSGERLANSLFRAPDAGGTFLKN